MSRPEVTQQEIEQGLLRVKEALLATLKEKGWHAYASSHEIVGVIDEEYDELMDEVRDNNPAGCSKELMDIAVAAVFGGICMTTRKVDWP